MAIKTGVYYKAETYLAEPLSFYLSRHWEEQLLAITLPSMLTEPGSGHGSKCNWSRMPVKAYTLHCSVLRPSQASGIGNVVTSISIGTLRLDDEFLPGGWKSCQMHDPEFTERPMPPVSPLCCSWVGKGICPGITETALWSLPPGQATQVYC